MRPGAWLSGSGPARQAGGHWFEPSTAHQSFITQTNTHGVSLVGVVVEGLFPGPPVKDLFGRDLRSDEVTDGGTQEGAEWFGEVCADVAAALDVDALEECLVDLPAEYRVGLEVRRA
jgi:hypothetical protein